MEIEDIKIETYDDVGLNDKIKAGESNIDKVIEYPDKDTGAEYEAEKTKERVVGLIEGSDSIIDINSSSNNNFYCNYSYFSYSNYFSICTSKKYE